MEHYPISAKVKEVFIKISEKSSLLRKEEAVELKDRVFNFLSNYSCYLESYFGDEKSKQALKERVITADDVNTYKKLSESVCRLIDDVNLIEEIRRSVIFLASFEGESILNLFTTIFTDNKDKPERDIINSDPTLSDVNIFPNPSNGNTTIALTNLGAAYASVTIYDVAGRKVKTWNIGGTYGTRKIEWDGTNERGKRVSSGIYYCVIRNNRKTMVKKIMLIR